MCRVWYSGRGGKDEGGGGSFGGEWAMMMMISVCNRRILRGMTECNRRVSIHEDDEQLTMG